MARWDDIARSVLENLNDEGIRDTNIDRIIAELTKVQTDIARDGLAIQGTATIVTVAAQTDYPVAAVNYRIAQLFRPVAWTRRITIVHDKEIWRRIIDRALTDTQPLFATIWNNNFILSPAPTDVQTVNLWTYDRPTNAAAEAADPDLQEQWDDCLTYGATARLMLKALPKRKDLEKVFQTWNNLYNNELLNRSSKEIKRMVLGPNKVDHSSQRLGF